MLVSLAGFTGTALLVGYLGSIRGVSPWLALFFRAAVGLLVVAVVFGPRGQLHLSRALRGRLLATRGILGAVSTACYYLTLPALGAGKATLIGNTWVIWGALLAVLWLGEPLGWRKLLGILLALSGIVFLMGLHGGDFTRLGGYDLIAVIGALLAAGVVVVIRQLTRTETSGTIFASQCAYAGLLALPFVVLLPLPAPTDAALLAAAGLLASLGQLAMTEGFRFLPVSVGGAFQILLPLTITLASLALFAEPFTLTQAAGGALILLGCQQTVSHKK